MFTRTKPLRCLLNSLRRAERASAMAVWVSPRLAPRSRWAMTLDTCRCAPLAEKSFSLRVAAVGVELTTAR